MTRNAIPILLTVTTLYIASVEAQGPPRRSDGRPDLAGIWQVNVGPGYGANVAADLAPEEILPWADTLYRRRMSALGSDDPWTVECLPLGPRSITGGAGGQRVRIVQTPELIVMLYEDLAYRSIHLDNRPLPKNPNPSFMGYSVGRWEGDTLVVDSVGFNERTWLDFGGHPHTEALHLTERYRRTALGSMELRVTFDDPGAYRRSWTVPVTVSLARDSDLLEYVCTEDVTHRHSLGGRTPEQSRITIPAGTLADYAGTYFVPSTERLGFTRLQIRHNGDDLYLDVDGHGNVLMVPLSVTAFSARLIDLEFRRNAAGAVTSAMLLRNGVVLMKER